jgi:hypothetical protein
MQPVLAIGVDTAAPGMGLNYLCKERAFGLMGTNLLGDVLWEKGLYVPGTGYSHFAMDLFLTTYALEEAKLRGAEVLFLVTRNAWIEGIITRGLWKEITNETDDNHDYWMARFLPAYCALDKVVPILADRDSHGGVRALAVEAFHAKSDFERRYTIGDKYYSLLTRYRKAKSGVFPKIQGVAQGRRSFRAKI